MAKHVVAILLLLNLVGAALAVKCPPPHPDPGHPPKHKPPHPAPKHKPPAVKPPHPPRPPTEALQHEDLPIADAVPSLSSGGADARSQASKYPSGGAEREEEIYAMLQEMEQWVGLVGYALDLSQAPMVPAEQEGEGRRDSLRFHSEMLIPNPLQL